MRGFVYIFLISSLFLLHNVQSKIVEGELTTINNWQFLTRFCFMSRDGNLEFEFEYPQKFLTQNLLLYWDGPQSWPSVYKSSLTCQQREDKLDVNFLQKFRLDTSFKGNANCRNYNGTIHCKDGPFPFATARARWWYLAISNCNAKDGMKIKYKVWMRNGKPGDLFQEHFSADEYSILHTEIAAVLVEFVILIICIVFAVMLHNKNMFHTTYHMFFTSVAFRVAYSFFSCIKWGLYANTGKEHNGLGYFADALAAISLVIFIIMLLLMALGYTIICGRLPTWMNIGICVFMFALIITYVILFIYEALIFDPGWVLYRYESKPGLGLVGLLICCWLAFTIGGIFTMVAHKRKRDFFIPFLIFYSVWFWAVPVMVFIAINHIPEWVRMRIVNGVENGIIVLGHAFYLILTRPTEGNHNFPYHIRTQQIDTITLEEATDKALENMESSNARTFNPDIFTVTTEPSHSDYRAQSVNTHAMFTVSDRPAQLPRSTSRSEDAPPTSPNHDQQERYTTSETNEPNGNVNEDFYVPRSMDAMFSFPPAPTKGSADQ